MVLGGQSLDIKNGLVLIPLDDYKSLLEIEGNYKKKCVYVKSGWGNYEVIYTEDQIIKELCEKLDKLELEKMQYLEDKRVSDNTNKIMSYKIYSWKEIFNIVKSKF